MLKNKLIKKIKLLIKKKYNQDIDVNLEFPSNLNFGDYSTPIAFKLGKIIKKNPSKIAEEIKNSILNLEIKELEKIEILNSGYLNFWINKNFLIKNAEKFSEKIFSFPKFYLGKNKKIMIEFAHPNTHKLFHIGHFRNISIGESLSRIFEALGNKVIRTNYQGDIGLHIAKCLWSIKNLKSQISNLKSLKQKIEFIGKMYTQGTKIYEKNEDAKREIIEINKMIYNQNQEIIPLWKETRQWSLEYFEKIYKRVYSCFDRLYFESEMTKRAIEICEKALRKNILEKSKGAIIFNGKKYNLDTRVFINSLGYPTYEGKELALAEKEFSEFGEIDKNIHIVTPEQTSFFKVTFKVQELINPKIKGKQYHLAYEWVNLKSGKMSSREGNIIEANWLIDQIKEKIIKNFKCDEKTAEILAVASAKYSFLKNSPQTPINFDIDESININGNSGPYIIYTYVRCQSLIKKSDEEKINTNKLKIKNPEELNILRKIYQFPEIVLKSAEKYSTNYIANYLYELSSLYNLFYQKHQILKEKNETKKLRLLLTQATANTIREGLKLLGIKTVEKM